MLYRSDKGYWELPAGKVEDDESVKEAAKREAREEIGTDVEIKEEWPAFRVSFEHEGRSFLARGFFSEPEERPEIQEERFSVMDWVSATELEGIHLAPNLDVIKDELKKILEAQ